MQQHSAEPLTRREIAAAAGITEDYLTQCFQQEMGISPITWLQRYRIKQSQALLQAGELSITDIALAVGFADGTHFGRLFQRETGVTPSAWRRGVRA
jgi:transcriptional regulator GlxA family with amidase domain